MPSKNHFRSNIQRKLRLRRRLFGSVGLRAYNLRPRLKSQRSAYSNVPNIRSAYDKFLKAASTTSDRGQQNVGCYCPLNQQKNEIRLLVLQPGVGWDPLHATLATCHLSRCPAFEALSYAWGNPEPIQPVFINGTRVMVTYNLDIALRNLRDAQSRRILWIDALCINQADVDERNRQVFLMSRIFSTAKHVLVWLGEARGRSDFAMDRLKDLAGGQEFAIREKELLRDLILTTLIDREWWGRLWIVQEAVLARSDPTIMCGSKWLPWDIFMSGCDKVKIDALYSSESRKNIYRLIQFNHLRQLRGDLSLELLIRLLPPSHLLTCTKDFHATDPRDKVYGCVGLLAEFRRKSIGLDYQKSVERVYYDMAKYLLESDSCSFFGRYSFSKTGRACPSWVPDFAAQDSLDPSNPLLFISRGSSRTYGRRCVSFQDDTNALTISGILFDTVETAIEVKGSQDCVFNQLPGLERLMEHAFNRKLSSDICYFSKLKKHNDILELFGGHHGDEPSLDMRHQYDVLAKGAKPPSSTNATASEYVQPLLLLINHILPGRFFFITRMGFVGIGVGRVRMDDRVTFLFGEDFPTILRPQGDSYSVIGAAHVPGIMDGELTGKMYKTGLVVATEFIIR